MYMSGNHLEWYFLTFSLLHLHTHSSSHRYYICICIYIDANWHTWYCKLDWFKVACIFSPYFWHFVSQLLYFFYYYHTQVCLFVSQTDIVHVFLSLEYWWQWLEMGCFLPFSQMLTNTPKFLSRAQLLLGFVLQSYHFAWMFLSWQEW